MWKIWLNTLIIAMLLNQKYKMVNGIAKQLERQQY